MLLAEVLRKLCLRLQCANFSQTRFEGSTAQLLDGGFIHARLKIIADLLLGGTAGAARVGRLLQNAPKELLVLVGEFGVHAPARLVGRDGVVLHPTAADV